MARIGLTAIVAPDQAVASDVRLGRTKLRRTKREQAGNAYDMLELGQGTFVLRRWLHVSGAEPVKRPDRSIGLRLGAEGRLAASTDGENHQDARAHSQRRVRQPQAEAAG
ncbi:MAG TPA: hypothetical protein VKF14_21630 [Candidatus Dormibacteraeota bacterium]|nr:hypothetical protein [Candidatus Dormibacteraeota bacterium]